MAAVDPRLLFDRPAWHAHRRRAARGLPVSFLHEEIADRLGERLDDIPRPFAVALDLGAHSGSLSRLLASRPGTRHLIAADPAPDFLAGLPGSRIAADPELIPFRPASLDLVASVLALHWTADLPGALAQIRRALKPDGLFLGAMLGGRTLGELRAVLLDAELEERGGASPRVSPMAELADAAGLLQRAGFAMPVADGDVVSVDYSDMLALMRDLRGMGETNALAERDRSPLPRRVLARAAALYAQRHGRPDGRIPAQFEILYLTGWAPHEAQPRPLRPGSAALRLADALGTEEVAAGDPAAPKLH